MANISLKEAILQGNENAVDELLNSGTIDINEIICDGTTPLMFAIEFVRFKQHRDEFYENFQNRNGDIALSRYKNDNITLRLISGGSDVHRKNIDGKTPLLMALDIMMGYETIYQLVDAGSNINVEANDGFTPLIYAVNNGYNKKLIVDLISAGAKVNHKNCNGMTALCLAVKKSNFEVAEALINVGANVHALDCVGCNLFSYINCFGCNEVNCNSKGIIDLLRKNGVDLKEVDNENNTLIHLRDCNYLIRLCICNGVSINARNNHGNTPLMAAAMYYKHSEYNDKVDSLLLFGADCSRIFSEILTYNNTSSFIHVIYPTNKIVSSLFYHGADLWARSFSNQTILDLVMTSYKISCIGGGVEAYIKHTFIFYDKKDVNDLTFGGYLDEKKIVEQLVSFCNDCKKELIKLQGLYLKDGLTFFEFCKLKRLYKSKHVDISIDEYNYNYEQIKEMFPIYNDLIIKRIKDNRIKLNKINLLKSLENIVVKPIPVNNENDSNVQINYDCFYYMCRSFNNKELQNLFLASIE